MESVDKEPDEEVGAEEAAKNDEKDKVQVHDRSGLIYGLNVHLQTSTDQ